MYRLFNRVDRGLEPVAAMFKKHVEAQGLALVKQVTDAMEARKTKDSGAPLLACDVQQPSTMQLAALRSRQRGQLDLISTSPSGLGMKQQALAVAFSLLQQQARMGRPGQRLRACLLLRDGLSCRAQPLQLQRPASPHASGHIRLWCCAASPGA